MPSLATLANDARTWRPANGAPPTTRGLRRDMRRGQGSQLWTGFRRLLTFSS